MRIVEDVNLSEFEWWGGAVDRAKNFTDDELDQLGECLEETVTEPMTATAVNDLMWFEVEYLCELIGLEYDSENDAPIHEKDEDYEEDTEPTEGDE